MTEKLWEMPTEAQEHDLSARLWEVHDERAKQDARWGEQNHPYADLNLVPTQYANAGMKASHCYDVPTADIARLRCQAAANQGRSTWADILLEEFCEFLEAAGLGDDTAARGELVQLAAVAVAAIQAHDRREAQKAARDGAC